VVRELDTMSSLAWAAAQAIRECRKNRNNDPAVNISALIGFIEGRILTITRQPTKRICVAMKKACGETLTPKETVAAVKLRLAGLSAIAEGAHEAEVLIGAIRFCEALRRSSSRDTSTKIPS